jgi:NADH-quinone oxidoreductase subunit H
MADFWSFFLFPLIIMLLESLVVLVPLLIIVAYVLLADRKIWAAVQMRRGPNVVGPWGLFQSFADLLKFILKEPVIPSGSNKMIFVLAPFVTTVLALAAWAVVPVSDGWVVSNINVGILYVFAISSLGVYGIIMGGWASNSKYPFLSALRSAAQMVSYEVSIGFVIITVLMCAGSLNLSAIVNAQNARGLGGLIGVPWLSFLNWYFIPLFPMFIIFFVSALAETNRPPFDLVPPIALPPFTWVPGIIWFLLKALFVFFMFAMVKAFVPRYRYDQLMRLGWKVFLPISLVSVVVVAGVLEITGWAP